MSLTWVEIFDEPHPAPPTTEEERREALRWRPHCSSCGRYISPKTLRQVAGPGLYEVDEHGVCGTCGPCSTSYPL